MARNPRTRFSARRRAVALAMLATLVVVLFDLAVRSLSDGPDKQVAYLDQVRPLIEDSNNQGRDLVDFRAGSAGLDRATFDRRLARIVDSAAATAEALRDVSPPRSLRSVDALLVSAFSVRAEALNKLRLQVNGLLADSTVADALAVIKVTIDDLRIADQIYSYFATSALGAEGVSAVPESEWLSDPAPWTPEALGQFVAALRANPDLATVRDLAVVSLSLSPSPVITDPDGVAVLALDEPLVVTVIVANHGARAEAAVEVVAELTLTDGAPARVVARVDLEPGQQKSVTFDALPTQVGRDGRLVVRITPAPTEQAVGDNEHSVRLRVRDPAHIAVTTTAAPNAPATTTTAA